MRKNSAVSKGFGFEPFPTDWLGKQEVFLHMSTHYRRMYSARSVVDSALGRSRSRPGTALSGKDRSQSTPRTTRRPGAECITGGVGAGAARGRPRTGTRGRPFESSGLQVLGRLSLRSQQLVQLYSKNARVPSTSIHEAIRLSEMNGIHPAKPMRFATSKSKRREPGDTGTYLAKLNQLTQESPSTRNMSSSAQLLATALKPGAPFMPRVLRSDVESRLRSSSVYCPPRPRPRAATRRPDLEGRSKPSPSALHDSLARPGVESPWIQTARASASPPGSSRDSAYNGGISSGGESHGHTPEHRITSKKKGSRHKEDKRNKKTGDQQAELSIRRMIETKRMEEMVEHERQQLRDNRVHARPWRELRKSEDTIQKAEESVTADESAPEAIPQTDAPSQTDDYQESSDDKDVEEEIEEEEQQKSEPILDKEDVQSQSQMSLSEEGHSQSRPLSPSVMEEEEKADGNRPDEDNQTTIESSRCSSATNGSVASLSHKSVQDETHTSNNPSSETERSSHVSSPNSVTVASRVSLIASAKKSIAVQASLNNSTAKVESFKPTQDSVSINQKYDNNFSNDTDYIRLLHSVTEDVRLKRILTNKALKALFQQHIEANRDKLDLHRMQEEIDKLRTALNIPKDDYLDNSNYGLGMPQMQQSSRITPSAPDSDVGHLDPVIARPSDLLLDTEAENKKFNLPSDLGKGFSDIKSKVNYRHEGGSKIEKRQPKLGSEATELFFDKFYSNKLLNSNETESRDFDFEKSVQEKCPSFTIDVLSSTNLMFDEEFLVSNRTIDLLEELRNEKELTERTLEKVKIPQECSAKTSLNEREVETDLKPLTSHSDFKLRRSKSMNKLDILVSAEISMDKSFESEISHIQTVPRSSSSLTDSTNHKYFSISELQLSTSDQALIKQENYSVFDPSCICKRGIKCSCTSVDRATAYLNAWEKEPSVGRKSFTERTETENSHSKCRDLQESKMSPTKQGLGNNVATSLLLDTNRLADTKLKSEQMIITLHQNKYSLSSSTSEDEVRMEKKFLKSSKCKHKRLLENKRQIKRDQPNVFEKRDKKQMVKDRGECTEHFEKPEMQILKDDSIDTSIGVNPDIQVWNNKTFEAQSEIKL